MIFLPGVSWGILLHMGTHLEIGLLIWDLIWVRANHPTSDHVTIENRSIWICLKIVYPYTQWLMIIIPIKWLFRWEYTLFSDKPMLQYIENRSISSNARQSSEVSFRSLRPRLRLDGKRWCFPSRTCSSVFEGLVTPGPSGWIWGI